MATFVDSTGCQTLITQLANRIKALLSKRLELSGGTMTGMLTVPSITICDNNKTGGTIEYDDDNSMYLHPSYGSGYVKLGGTNCTVDVDGWITTPSVHITDPTNTDGGGTLRMTVDNEVYDFNVTTAIELGILQKP